jgi:diaminopimelate epimerase
MIEIPFTKLHGAENDFLLTWSDPAYAAIDLPQLARRICNRHTAIGADGWMLVDRAPGGLRTRLFNPDGSEPEISGNGTRCAAAFALIEGAAHPPDVVITTNAGPKHLCLIAHQGTQYVFEMNMGQPEIDQLSTSLYLAGECFDASLLNVGNPQCAIFVDRFPANWLAAAREAEQHPRFPHRANVSFVHPLDRHTLEILFFERGAGETRSSGTGSTGAAVAAILRNVADSPVEIKTPAGSLYIRWEKSVFLTGPAEVIGEGRFFLEL